MTPAIFSTSLLVGLGLLAGGVAWRFSIADALIVSGIGVIVLTFLVLKAAGRG